MGITLLTLRHDPINSANLYLLGNNKPAKQRTGASIGIARMRDSVEPDRVNQLTFSKPPNSQLLKASQFSSNWATSHSNECKYSANGRYLGMDMKFIQAHRIRSEPRNVG